MAKASKTKETKPKINDLEWTDYVLGLLSEDEKISGNPTTDGLRRVFEIAMECVVTESVSQVCQSPTPENEKRATVVHSMTYVLKNLAADSHFNTITVNGAADVYWGNCDKIFRNHPVAVAETRAEGRCLRRALKLKKVLAAEEVVENIEDNPDAENSNKISLNQINFINVLAERLNIDVRGLINSMHIEIEDAHKIEHKVAVDIIRKLSEYQRNMEEIPSDIMGYNKEWI
jgi:hypothetical protein